MAGVAPVQDDDGRSVVGHALRACP
jgi:hypothetical protein